MNFMVDSDAVLVLTTFPDQAQVPDIVREMIRLRLAACAQLHGNVTSIYRWNGKVHEEGEIVVIFKTSRAAAPSLEAELKKRHPYEVPEFLVVSTEAGGKEYLEWLEEETYSGLRMI